MAANCPSSSAWRPAPPRSRIRLHAERFMGNSSLQRMPAGVARARRGDVNVSLCIYMDRSEEHTSELQSHLNLVCRLLLEKKKKNHVASRYRHTTPPRCVVPREARCIRLRFRHWL